MDTDRYMTTGEVTDRARTALDELHDKELNFDLAVAPTEDEGWRFDDHCQPLPPEPPGDPVEGGTFEVARELLAAYEFADPAIVRAVYYPDRPMVDRDMVLEARFYGLKFLLGLRVGGVRDETVHVDGRPVRLWGWNYRTLTGHLEMGQMDYEVWKWTDTGDVEFRITAFSKAARIDNLIIRAGFAVFGRWMQKRFARHAMARMRRLVELRLIEQATGEPVPREGRLGERAAAGVRVERASRSPVDLPEDRAGPDDTAGTEPK